MNRNKEQNNQKNILNSRKFDHASANFTRTVDWQETGIKAEGRKTGKI